MSQQENPNVGDSFHEEGEGFLGFNTPQPQTNQRGDRRGNRSSARNYNESQSANKDKEQAEIEKEEAKVQKNEDDSGEWDEDQKDKSNDKQPETQQVVDSSWLDDDNKQQKPSRGRGRNTGNNEKTEEKKQQKAIQMNENSWLAEQDQSNPKKQGTRGAGNNQKSSTSMTMLAGQQIQIQAPTDPNTSWTSAVKEEPVQPTKTPQRGNRGRDRDDNNDNNDNRGGGRRGNRQYGDNNYQNGGFKKKEGYQGGRGRGDYNNNNDGRRNNRDYQNNNDNTGRREYNQQGRGRGEYNQRGGGYEQGGRGNRGNRTNNYENKDQGGRGNRDNNYQKSDRGGYQDRSRNYNNDNNQDRGNRNRNYQDNNNDTTSQRNQKPEVETPKVIKIQPRGQKCWPEISIFIMETKISFSYRQIAEHVADVLIIPYRDHSFKVYPGNLINKFKVDYRQKLIEKGAQVSKVGTTYTQKCVGMDNFKAIGFTKIGGVDQLPICFKNIFTNIKKVKQNLTTLLLPYSSELGPANIVIREIFKIIGANQKVFDKIYISTNKADDFTAGMKAFYEQINRFTINNEICIDF